MPNTEATLKQLLTEKILIIDGAMGTMIQALKFDEKDFRGERFAEHPKALKAVEPESGSSPSARASSSRISRSCPDSD